MFNITHTYIYTHTPLRIVSIFDFSRALSRFLFILFPFLAERVRTRATNSSNAQIS